MGLKIGDVAEKTGLSIPTLRHYDTVGLVTPSGRSPGGFRLYSRTDLEKILRVRRMKPLGFTLEQMRDFLAAAEALQTPDSPGTADLAAARAVLAEIDEEARTRYRKLQRQLGYAEEFLTLVDSLKE